VIHAIGDGPTITAQNSLTTAYNNLAGRPTTVNLSGQDLGGLTLVPGVYNFGSSAQLTGTLTLNGLNNPNSVFIFNIGSTLTTASASAISLINMAQGANVFWRVGSSATLGTSTSFAGDILALTSITLVTSASITCGAAWARNGAVTLDTNKISLCALISGAPGAPGGVVLGPTGFPLFTSLLPSSASVNDFSVATGLDSAIGSGVTVPLSFLNLFNLTPSELANALTQLSGEAGTGAQESGFRMMNSFLSLLANPFAENRGLAPERPRPPLVYKAPIYKAPAAPEPRRWSVWGAAYGGGGNINGDPNGVGSNNLTTRDFGFATGLDYRVAPDTAVGFALAGGGTSWGLAAGLGGGRSDVFQAGLYGLQQYGAAYLSGALAYGSYWANTSRTLTFAGSDTLSASYNAQSFGGRLEGGYRLTPWAPFSVMPFSVIPFGVIPYAAVQAESFRTPGYSESGSLGAPDPFALSYAAQTATLVRSELGSRFDHGFAQADGSSVVLFGRAAWAHDWQSNPNLTASFLGLPTATFVVSGATPPKNLALATAGAEWFWRDGWSFMAKLDGEFAKGSDAYIGTARVRYSW
jgi:outer membrane autotransporter protein